MAEFSGVGDVRAVWAEENLMQKSLSYISISTSPMSPMPPNTKKVPHPAALERGRTAKTGGRRGRHLKASTRRFGRLQPFLRIHRPFLPSIFHLEQTP